jgi:hypothetical protein
MDKSDKRETKKPYSKPKLTVYGTMVELTQKVGHSGNLDGQIIPLQPNKTHV